MGASLAAELESLDDCRITTETEAKALCRLASRFPVGAVPPVDGERQIRRSDLHHLVGLFQDVDEDLADWVDEHVAFPNGMVDRIAFPDLPDATSDDREVAAVAARGGHGGTAEIWPHRGDRSLDAPEEVFGSECRKLHIRYR